VLIEKQFPHHSAVAFQHAGRALFNAVRLLGLEDVNAPRPAATLYPSDNPFEARSSFIGNGRGNRIRGAPLPCPARLTGPVADGGSSSASPRRAVAARNATWRRMPPRHTPRLVPPCGSSS
jgi:hypothetical protein